MEFTAVPYHARDHREPGEMAVWLPEDPALARAPAKPTIANTSRATCSHVNPTDTLDALSDGEEGRAGLRIPRFTWWPRKGTDEWVQYDFRQPTQVRRVTVKWFDDTGAAAAQASKSWRVVYRDGGEWNRSRRSIRTAPPRPSNRSPRRRCGWSPSSHPTGPEDPGMAGGIGGSGLRPPHPAE